MPNDFLSSILGGAQDLAQGAWSGLKQGAIDNRQTIQNALLPLLLAPPAMALVGSLSKRHARGSNQMQTLGMFSNLAMNQLLKPGKQADAYAQAAINSGQWRPAKPGEQGTYTFGGVQFKDVPTFQGIPTTVQHPLPAGQAGPPAPPTQEIPTWQQFFIGQPQTPQLAGQIAPILAKEELLKQQQELQRQRDDQFMALYGNDPNLRISQGPKGTTITHVPPKQWSPTEQAIGQAMQNDPTYATRLAEKKVAPTGGGLKPQKTATGTYYPPGSTPPTEALKIAGYIPISDANGGVLFQNPPKPPTTAEISNRVEKINTRIQKQIGDIQKLPNMLAVLNSEIGPDGVALGPGVDPMIARQIASLETMIGGTGKQRLNQADIQRLENSVPFTDKYQLENWINMNIGKQLFTPDVRLSFMRVANEIGKQANRIILDQYEEALNTKPDWVPADQIISKERLAQLRKNAASEATPSPSSGGSAIDLDPSKYQQ